VRHLAHIYITVITQRHDYRSPWVLDKHPLLSEYTWVTVGLEPLLHSCSLSSHVCMHEQEMLASAEELAHDLLGMQLPAQQGGAQVDEPQDLGQQPMDRKSLITRERREGLGALLEDLSLAIDQVRCRKPLPLSLVFFFKRIIEPRLPPPLPCRPRSACSSPGKHTRSWRL
jgi:hypothetical protein